MRYVLPAVIVVGAGALCIGVAAMFSAKRRRVSFSAPMDIPEDVDEIMKRLEDNGYEAYIVGGATRDTFMGVTPKDYDIFTDADGDAIQELFRHRSTAILGGEERQAKILTVLVDGIEVSQYRANADRTETGTDLEVHLGTCDLTVNAIAMDRHGNIVDPFGGVLDVRGRVIRAVGRARDRIDEDKLRALRAVRFACRLDGEMDDELVDAISSTDVTDLPPERLREELFKCMVYPDSLRLLYDVGLLQQLIPELRVLYGLDGGRHHDETVLEHLFLAFERSCELTNDVRLRFACFMHDIGKGPALDEDEYGNNVFYRHEHIGQGLVTEIMERLKFSKKDIAYVQTAVKYHMMDPNMGKKAWKRLFIALEDNGVPVEDFTVVLFSDAASNTARADMKYHDFMKARGIIARYHEMKNSDEPMRLADLEIDGNDLIELGMIPGPELGSMLRRLYSMVENGEVPNRRLALRSRAAELLR